MLINETDIVAEVVAARRRGLTLDTQLTVSEWADRYRMLPTGSSEPGPWRTARVPYLKDIMDALSTSSAVERVVFMKAAQTGGTEAALNAIGYWIDHAPGVILAVWPSIDMVRKNSRIRIDPLIADTPALRRKVASPKAKDSGNTVVQKEFTGGSLNMTGANSATGLRSTPARYLVLDEVDGFPIDVGEEGDPVALAIKRTATFRGRRKILMISTPTLAGVSRIEKEYLRSDRRRYFVPCPHCREMQPLVWDGVKWPDGEPGKAFYMCQATGCGGIIEEADKSALLAAGEWRATAEGDGRTAGFHVSALYSPFETWGEVATDYLVMHRDPVELKSWTNISLGEAFEDRDTAPLSPDSLMARAEDHGELLPERALVLTCGVDTQDDRLELEVVAWGLGEECWSIAYEVIHGNTAGAEPWQALDRIIAKRFRHPRAGELAVSAVAIDSGGHRTDQVMRFSAERLQRRVWAIKGRGGPGVPPWPKRPPKPRRAALAPVHIVGVDTVKATLFARLRAGGDDGAAREGPGVIHLPANRDDDWFHGLVSERAVRKYRGAVAHIEWVKDPGVRNEPLDCRVYATAALHGLFAAGLDLGAVSASIAALPPQPDATPMLAEPAPPLAPSLKVLSRSKWMAR
jgi:phage terminase large subunit GpA-like protein